MLLSWYVIILFFFFFLLTILLFYWNILPFTVNLRVEIMKADRHATRVWWFYKRLVLHLVGGFVKKMQNNKTKPNNKETTQANVFSACVGKSFGLFTWSHAHGFSSCCRKANSVQAEPVSPRNEDVLFAVNGWAGHFVSQLVSCRSNSVSKGAEAAREVFWAMGADEFLSFPTGSVSTLQYRTWQSCLGTMCRVNVSHTCWTRAGWLLGTLAFLVLRWRESPCLQMAAPSSSHLAIHSVEAESAGWSEPLLPTPYSLPFTSQGGPREVPLSLRWQVTWEQELILCLWQTSLINLSALTLNQLHLRITFHIVLGALVTTNQVRGHLCTTGSLCGAQGHQSRHTCPYPYHDLSNTVTLMLLFTDSNKSHFKHTSVHKVLSYPDLTWELGACKSLKVKAAKLGATFAAFYWWKREIGAAQIQHGRRGSPEAVFGVWLSQECSW